IINLYCIVDDGYVRKPLYVRINTLKRKRDPFVGFYKRYFIGEGMVSWKESEIPKRVYKLKDIPGLSKSIRPCFYSLPLGTLVYRNTWRSKKNKVAMS
nr:hypothetical protein [Tanacetum cinerariifolium]